MTPKRLLAISLLLGGVIETCAADNGAGVWTDPKDETLPPEFAIQGEYAGPEIGAQVIALGDGALHAVVYKGGLPGAGWNGRDKSLLAGKVGAKRANLKTAMGERRYLAANPNEFSATRDFPPTGQTAYSARIGLKGARMILMPEGADRIVLKKLRRKSPTLGMRPPNDALTLFDGTGTESFVGGRLDEETKFLNTDGANVRTEKKFDNYRMHIEFMLPFRPLARGQGRGNSGFYQVDQYEVQILDSFGLDGYDNECGGVYQKARPLVNMCYPPLTWQTYDVEFHNAERENGEKIKNATMTLKHNGVIIHENLEIDGKTGGARNEPEGTPGPIQLQGHGNPLQFRNIWVVELD